MGEWRKEERSAWKEEYWPLGELWIQEKQELRVEKSQEYIGQQTLKVIGQSTRHFSITGDLRKKIIFPY